MAFFCSVSLLLLFASKTLALPNILSLNHLHPISLQKPNGNSSVAATISLHPSSLQDSVPIIYRVPNTPITLRFDLKDAPIEPQHMARTVLQIQVRLRRFIAAHYRVTNDVLDQSDNPYMSDPALAGCFFAVTHWPMDRQKRLTYGMVSDTLKGVWEFLYEGGRFVCTEFYVRDDQAGTVGYGMVLTQSPTPNLGNISMER